MPRTPLSKGRCYPVGVQDPVSKEWRVLMELPSATTILNFWGGKDALTNWKVKQAKEGLDPNKIATDAANRGTDVHKAVEELFAFGEIDLEQYPSHAQGLVQWFNIHKPKLVEGEYPTAHLTEGYAGRLDLRLSYPHRRPTGQIGLVDIKTVSKNDYLSNEWPPFETQQAQLVAYAMAEISLGKQVDFLEILRLGPDDGKYHIYPIQKDTWPRLFAAFLGALRIREVMVPCDE